MCNGNVKFSCKGACKFMLISNGGYDKFTKPTYFNFVVDLQMVNISLRVLSRPEASQLPQICRQLGTDYDERVLPSICNEVSHKS